MNNLENKIYKIIYGLGIINIFLALILLGGWGDITPENINTENNLILSFVFGVSGIAFIGLNPLSLKDLVNDKDI